MAGLRRAQLVHCKAIEAAGGQDRSSTLSTRWFIGSRFEILAILLLGIMALAPNLNSPPLLDWDEATYAEVAHEAVASGHYLELTWNGKPYLKKPPLLFWMVAASFKTFGESEFAARLPSILMGLGTLLLLYLNATLAAGRIAGLFAALIPLGFYYFIARGGRECATDAPLIFFSTLSIYAFTRALGNRRWLWLAGVSCGLAFLSKGAAAIIVLAVVSLAVAMLPAFRELGPSGLIELFSAAFVVAAPWYLYQALSAYPLFFSSFLSHENLARVLGHLEDETQGSGYTLRIFAREIRYLWPLLIPASGLTLMKLGNGWRTALRTIPAPVTLWALWLIIALGAACAVQTKLPWYVLPALIPAAILAASVSAAALRQSGGAGRALALVALAALTITLLSVPSRWRGIRTTRQIQLANSTASYVLGMKARRLAEQHGGGELFYAGPPMPTMVYYSGLRCHFVDTSMLMHVELAGAQARPRRVRVHDLVLLAPEGGAEIVSNLDREWMLSTPGAATDEIISEFDNPDSGDAAD